MNKPDLNDYTIEELEAMNQDLMNQRREIIFHQRQVAAVLADKRKRAAVESEIQAIRDRHGIDLAVVK